MDVDPNSAAALPIVISGMAVMGLFCLSLILWCKGLFAVFRGKRWLPVVEPRRPQPWGMVDLMFSMCLFIFLQIVGGKLAIQSGIMDAGAIANDEPNLMFQFSMSAICSLAVVGATFFIITRCKSSMTDAGWSLQHFASDIRLGFVTFVIVAPPTYVLMTLATLVSGVPYEHPIMSEAKETPALLYAAIIMAVVLAPLMEEFAFRVLFQGFLESMSIGRFSIQKLVMGRVAGSTYPDHSDSLALHPDNQVPNPIEDRLEQPFGYEAHGQGRFEEVAVPEYSNPYASIPVSQTEYEPQLAVQSDETNLVPWWPCVVTGVLFGLAHFSYGVSWIPLCFLGFALGWLYRATNRIWPCIVVHCCFNGFTMFLFTMNVLYGVPME